MAAGRVTSELFCLVITNLDAKAGPLSLSLRRAFCVGRAGLRQVTKLWRSGTNAAIDPVVWPRAAGKGRACERRAACNGPLVEPNSALSRIWKNNALSLVLVALFLGSLALQIHFGRAVYNEQRQEAGQAVVSLGSYLSSGHFVEALFENWESEFLQMGAFILLAVKLRQKGSTESRPFDEPCESDADPRVHLHDPEAPWPVRRGGWLLRLYEHSLSLTFFGLFLLSFVFHALGGRIQHNEELAAHGKPAQSLLEFVASSQFWFESFQNWQSEFLAIASVVVLSIFLRERGSPQSKPVAAPHSDTGA